MNSADSDGIPFCKTSIAIPSLRRKVLRFLDRNFFEGRCVTRDKQTKSMVTTFDLKTRELGGKYECSMVWFFQLLLKCVKIVVEIMSAGPQSERVQLPTADRAVVETSTR